MQEKSKILAFFLLFSCIYQKFFLPLHSISQNNKNKQLKSYKKMTIYTVGEKEFYTLSAAKKEMKATGLQGFKTRIYSNGDWEPCGYITLKGSNATLMSGATRQTVANYN